MKKSVTIRDVARHAGVSIASVSYLLNGKTDRCGTETRQRIEASMAELGFEPDFTARSLSQGRNFLIGLILPLTRHEDLSTSLLRDNPFYGEFYDALAQISSPAGFDIMLRGYEHPEDAMPWVRKRKLDGIISLGAAPPEGFHGIDDIPLVLVDCLRPTGRAWPLVRTNDIAASAAATDSLLDLGHRNIAFISGEKAPSYVNRDRYAGFSGSLSKRGLSCPARLVIEDSVSFEGGYRAAIRLLEEGGDFSAAFCAADVMAFGFIRALQDRGVAVPRECAVMGFDDISNCRHFRPLLSTVRQDIGEKGRQTAELLLDTMDGGDGVGREILIPFEIMNRESTKAWGKG